MSDVARRDRLMSPEKAAELADGYDAVLAKLGTKDPALRREIERMRDALRRRAEAASARGRSTGSAPVPAVERRAGRRGKNPAPAREPGGAQSPAPVGRNRRRDGTGHDSLQGAAVATAPAVEEQDRLATWWACHYGRRAAARGVGADELLAACRLGVAEAGATFDPSAGRSFAAHAARPIRRRIAEALGGGGGRP